MPVGFRLVVPDQEHGQLHQNIGKRNQRNGRHQIEDGLEIGDVAAVHRPDPEIHAEYRQFLQHRHHNQEQDRSDGIEGDVHDAGALGILGGADGAHHGGGHAGAQVDAHNHRIGHGEGNSGAGDRSHRLEHAHRCGGALDNHRQHQAEQNAHQGILQEFHKRHEGCGANQGLDAVGHQAQAYKQHTKAHENIADGFGGLGLHKHQQDNTHNQGHRRQGIRIKQHQHQAVTGLNGGQTNDLCRYRSADVGAHDNGNRLFQVQHTCTNQSNRQHNGGRGTLNHRRYQRTGQNAHQHISRHFFQHTLQRRTGAVFQAVAHDLDTIEEHSKTAQKLDDGSENIHTKLLNISVVIAINRHNIIIRILGAIVQ